MRLLLTLLLCALALPALAQDKGKARGKAKGTRPEVTVAREQAGAGAKGDKAEAAKGDEADGAERAGPVHEEIRGEGEGEVKVMEFSGLDIEGQLKTPQMLYFLNRLRAEFGRPRLPHRSFMPELQRSSEDKSLK